MSILTPDEVRQNLRYEVDELGDDEANAFIAEAEQAIKDYITDAYDEANPVLKRAAKLLIGYWDEYRNAEQEMVRNGNYLPDPVQSLLYHYRTPTVI